MEDDPWSSSSPWDAPSSSSALPLPTSSSLALPTSSGTPLTIEVDDDLGILPSNISSVRRPSADSDPWGIGEGGVWGSSQQDGGTRSGGMDDDGWGGSLDYQNEGVSLEISNSGDANVSREKEEKDMSKQADDKFREPDTKLSSSSPPPPSSSSSSSSSSSLHPSSPKHISSLPISLPSSPYAPPVSFSPPAESENRPETEFEPVDLALNEFSHPISPIPVDGIPSNTSFDDFGEFGGSSGPIGSEITIGDDPWAIQGGPGNDRMQSEEDGVTSVSNIGWGVPVERDEDDAWGVRKAVDDEDKAAKKVDDWERVRILAERRMARAPPHVISELIEKWSVLAHDRYPDPEKKSVIEGEEAVKTGKDEPIQTEVDKYLDMRLANMKEITNLLVDLTDLPPTITSFSKPLYRTSLTERRFKESLARSSRIPTSTSLLVVPRRLPSLNTTYQSPSSSQGFDINADDNWTSRSRLGEPENVEVPTAEDEQSSRGGLLNFFGRKVSGQTAPGMGKRSTSVSSLASFSAPSSEDATKASTAAAASSSTTSPPISQSVRNSLEQIRLSTPNVSKPATPRPSLSARSSSLSLPAISEPALSGPSGISTSASVDSTPVPTEVPAPAAPSAVSRFLNRFSRKPAARPTDGPRALELSAGDFDFLAEVEGSESGADLDGDFLGSFGVPIESSSSVGGLEEFLQSKKSKDVPLPAPLAPPPRTSGPTRSDSPLSASVPRLLETQTDELDFLGSGGLQSSNGFSSGTNQATTIVDEWDDFLSDQPVKPTTASSTISPATPSFAPPKPPSLNIATTFPSLMTSSPLVPSRPPSTSASASTIHFNPFPPHSATPIAPAQSASASTQPIMSHDEFADEDDFGDFGDFGQPATNALGSTFQPTSDSFDDFDTFASFSPTSNKPSAVPHQPTVTTNATITTTTSPLSMFSQSPIRSARVSMLASESPPPTPVNKSPRHQRDESYARSFEAKNDHLRAESKPVPLPILLPPPPSSNNSRKPTTSLMDDSFFENSDRIRTGHSASVSVPRTSTPILAPLATSSNTTVRKSTDPQRETSGSGRSIGSMSELLNKAQEVDVAKGHWTYTGPTSPPVMALPPPPPVFGSTSETGTTSPGFFWKGDEGKLGGFPVLGGMSISNTVKSDMNQEKSKGGLSQADLSFFDGL